jgi:hypothetical protein
MPLMEVTLRQTYYGNEVINRWNYLASGTTSAVTYSFALAAAFGAVPGWPVYGDPDQSIIARMQTLQSTQLQYLELEARALYSPTDFYLRPWPTPITGDVAGDGLSPTQAIGFISNRTRTDIRRATKRIGGISEGASGAGGVVTTDYLTSAGILAELMADTISYVDEGQTINFQPIVMSREKYTTDKGTEAYRIYPTETEQLDHIMTSITWQAYTRLRTQVSRQYGRGA